MPSKTKCLVRTLLATAAPLATVAADIVDDSQCDCFVTDGKYPTYYAEHKFFDFRSLQEHAGVPDVPDSIEANRDADFTSAFFNYESEFGAFWGPQKWTQTENPALTNQYSFNNLYIEKNPESDDTFLTMRTARKAGFQTSAEFESKDHHQFASIRTHSRTIGAEGACSALFTYLNTDGTLASTQEADIEILTSKARNSVYYTNQPQYREETGEAIEGAQHIIQLPHDWTEWSTHRMDWTPKVTVWSLDGEQTHENDFQVPRDASQLMFNMWSNGDAGWTGEMPVGEAAYQQIQWIELLYGPASKETCSRVCSIDNSPELGKAVRV